MRLWLYSALLFVVFISGCNLGNKNLKVVSFNIRYSDASDGANSWDKRKPLVQEFLEKGKFDIVSFQEVLKPQLDFLENTLNNYSVISAGRDNGKDKGEHCPIFFKTSRFDLLAKSHFWLSDTPEDPGSISWGARHPRIVTWVKLQNKKTGHIFFVFNTHLSHVSEYARNKSVLLLLDKIKSIADNIPVIVTGDFNTLPGSQPYMLMTGNWHNHFSFSDSYKISTFPSIDAGLTFNGFKNKSGIKRLDYIFVNGYLDVVKFKTFNEMNDGNFISDHFPIMAEVKFNIDRVERNGENKPLPHFAPKPVFETSVIVFEDSLVVPLRSDIIDAKIFYSVDGSVPDSSNGTLYTTPILINENTTITAVTVAGGFLTSAPEKRTFLKGKINNAKLVSISPKPSGRDLIKTCNWLFDGYIMNQRIQSTECVNIAGKDIQVVFKLKKPQRINEVFIDVLKESKRCVYPPAKIIVSVSANGYNYRNHQTLVVPKPFTGDEGRIHILYRLKVSGKAAYVKVKLINPGDCPNEFMEKKEPSRIIVDEIGVL